MYRIDKNGKEVNSSRGVELNAKNILHITKIFNKCWAKYLAAEGIIADDALQDIYIGIMNRNVGSNPYDPSVSKLSTYLNMVVRSVCLNILDKERRYRRRSGYLNDFCDVAELLLKE